MMRRLRPVLLLIILQPLTAKANNVAIDVTADPPANGPIHAIGDIVRVAVRVRAETTVITSLELAQVDLKLTNATLVPQFDPSDSINPITDAVIFGGAAAGEGQGPGIPGSNGANYDAYPGPLLPGCPASCLVGSVPSASGGGTIYFWLRTSTANSALLAPPPGMPGRLFIQFKIQLDAFPVTVNATGPALDDGSSSGGFFQQATTGTIWSNGDADTVNNVSGGILTLVPEPAALGLLLPALLTPIRRRV